MNLSALDNDGKAIDWWFMYKVSKRSQGQTELGTEYLYYDSSDEKNATGMKMATQTVDKGGALMNTLNQIYKAPVSDKMGWWFYNDEDPIKELTNGDRGHSKGVVAFDLTTNTAFWLIQSVPLFPLANEYSYPVSGEDMAQTLLCITLKDVATVTAIANQMYLAQRPNVFLASKIPIGLDPKDPKALILSNQANESAATYSHILPFQSKAGKTFTCIAKNAHYPLSFYNDLVGPTLAANLEVETWEDGLATPPAENAVNHQVVSMKSVNLKPLSYNISWSEAVDHAKLAISDKIETARWVCVGDINFTESQDKRSGGTVAFLAPNLWKNISSILESVQVISTKKS